jgi:hypothetical protein
MKTALNKLTLGAGIVSLGVLGIGAAVFHEDIAVMSGGIMFAVCIAGKVALTLTEK